jgi:hypothetical protein
VLAVGDPVDQFVIDLSTLKAEAEGSVAHHRPDSPLTARDEQLMSVLVELMLALEFLKLVLVQVASRVAE